jgi:hypothetical protein
MAGLGPIGADIRPPIPVWRRELPPPLWGYRIHTSAFDIFKVRVVGQLEFPDLAGSGMEVSGR